MCNCWFYTKLVRIKKLFSLKNSCYIFIMIEKCQEISFFLPYVFITQVTVFFSSDFLKFSHNTLMRRSKPTFNSFLTSSLSSYKSLENLLLGEIWSLVEMEFLFRYLSILQFTSKLNRYLYMLNSTWVKAYLALIFKK